MTVKLGANRRIESKSQYCRNLCRKAGEPTGVLVDTAKLPVIDSIPPFSDEKALKALELAQYKMTEIELSGVQGVGLLSGEFQDLDPDYQWEVHIDPTGMGPWNKVTVVVWNRNLREGGRIHLTSYMLSAPMEIEHLRR